MAKVNWNNFSNQFGNAFTSTFLQTQKLAQQEAQFSQEMNFQNRQLQLGEAFRRDELAETIKYHKTYGDYLNSLDENADLDRDTSIQEGKSDLAFKGIFPIDENTPEGTPTVEMYNQTYAIPKVPQKRSTFGSIGNGFFGETQYEDNTVVGYEDVKESSYIINDSSNGLRSADISNEVGEVNKLLELYKGFGKSGDKIEVPAVDNQGNPVIQEWDKGLWRANAKRYATDMLSKVGIDIEGGYLENIRQEAKIPTYGKNQWESFTGEKKNEISKNKEKALLNEIYNRYTKGLLTQQQYEALRYWALVGTK